MIAINIAVRKQERWRFPKTRDTCKGNIGVIVGKVRGTFLGVPKNKDNNMLGSALGLPS